MYEYSSVSASSYDPGALVAKLNEAAADGWDVVSIVPTGGDVSAFLRRDLDAELDEAIAEEVALEDAIAEEEAIEEAEAELAAEDALVAEEIAEEAAAEEAGEPTVADEAAAVAAGAWAADGATEAAPSEPAGVVEVTEVAEVTEPVEEPAGWATAPAAADESPAETASATPEDATPVAEPSPAPAPEPEPEPVPVPPAAAPEPAPVVTTPAGWYPDPAGRYELRYWDSTQWTEHVARQGQQFTDPPVR
jgi:hypothetical protein